MASGPDGNKKSLFTTCLSYLVSNQPLPNFKGALFWFYQITAICSLSSCLDFSDEEWALGLISRHLTRCPYAHPNTEHAPHIPATEQETSGVRGGNYAV